MTTALAATPCADLQTVSISQTTIESAALVPAGPFAPAGGRGGIGARGGLGARGGAATCLTPGQLESVQSFYGGVKNSKGELIFSGQALGNPISAQAPSGNPGRGYSTVSIWGFQDENRDWRTFDLDRDMPLIDARTGFVDAVNPDLRPFKEKGGKLLLYAGWGDTAITPENTVLYYESVLEEMGSGQGDWLRLFMVPSMGHCGGGPGPSTFDSLGTLEAWRELVV